MATAQQIGQGGVPLSELEKRIWADIEWAEHDGEVRAKYSGQWIAIYERAVLAHGSNREQVLRQGAEAVQRPQEELAVWPVLSDMALAHDPQAASEF
ncbi:MAG TPA: DUF5678 domain-containing protein [Gemmataceae bacterium]|nr:DUF5678 domain-containing protein [Gemmataceae bacterium]